MPLSLLNTLALICKEVGIVDYVKLAIWADKQFERINKKYYYNRYHAGMRMIADQRREVTQLLKDLYHPSVISSANLWLYNYTDGPGYKQRELPLVSINNLPVLTRGLQNVDFDYKGKLENNPKPSEKELADNVSLWKAAELDFRDGLCYSMAAQHDTGKFDLRGSRFLTYRATIATVLDELALAVKDHGIKKLHKKQWNLLPLRTKYLGSCQALLDLNHRICLGGANVLFAVRIPKDKLALVIQRRSRYVSDEPGTLTVVPKFFHESIIDPKKEADMESSIYREIYEELFGGEDRPGKRRYLFSDYYHKLCPAVKDLYDNRNNPDHNILTPICLAWDLLRGNYHFAYCFYVKEQKWWEEYNKQIQVNWEVDEEVKPVVMADDHKQIYDLIAREDWAPEAYISFIEGLRWLQSTNEKSLQYLQLPELSFTAL